MLLSLQEYEYPEKLQVWLKAQEEHQKKHVGTHIDTYNNTRIIYDTNRVKTRIIDVRGIVEVNIASIGLDSLVDIEFVIFRTAYMEEYGYGSDDYLKKKPLPYLNQELVDALINIGIKFIGIDLHGIMHSRNHKIIDMYCEDRGTYVIENLCNLDKVKEEIYCKLVFEQGEEESAIPVKVEVL